MTIFGSITKSLAGSTTSVSKALPLSALPSPSAIPTPPRAIVPSPSPLKNVEVNAKPVEPPATKPSEPKPSSGGGGTAMVGLGIAGASLLPTLLNSSVVQSAVSGATQVGSVAVVADQVAGVANNLVDSITGDPVNMALFGVGTVAVLYLLWR